MRTIKFYVASSAENILLIDSLCSWINTRSILENTHYEFVAPWAERIRDHNNFTGSDYAPRSLYAEFADVEAASALVAVHPCGRSSLASISCALTAGIPVIYAIDPSDQENYLPIICTFVHVDKVGIQDAVNHLLGKKVIAGFEHKYSRGVIVPSMDMLCDLCTCFTETFTSSY